MIAQNLTMVSINALDARTIAAKADDAIASYFAHTQAWTFDGGDAIISVGPNSSIIIFIRVGARVARLTGYEGIAGVFENPPAWIPEALEKARPRPKGRPGPTLLARRFKLG